LRHPIVASLRHRDFRLLWTGMAASLIGDGVFLVALAWQVYSLSGHPSALAMVGLAVALPQVALLLFGGVLSDRLDRRQLMVGADVVRGAAVAGIGALSVAGTLNLGTLAALAAVYGGATAFFGPAFDAIVPDLVPADELAGANSLDQLVRPAALRLLGPALGGAIIALSGVGVAFLVDAATFAVSVVAVLRMTSRPVNEQAEPGSSPLRDIQAGFRFVRSHVWLWGTFGAAAIAYLLFMGPVEVLLPYVVKNQLREGAAILGVVFAMGGLGAIAGAIVVGHRGIPRRHITFMFLAWTLATLAVAGYGLARLPWQVMAASFAFNALETAGTIVWATTKQRSVPARMLGRVSSFDWFISIGLLPVSFALTAPVAAALGVRATLVGAGLLGAAVTLAALFLPGMRDQERAAPLHLRVVEPTAVAADSAVVALRSSR
jgi:MFS family permease